MNNTDLIRRTNEHYDFPFDTNIETYINIPTPIQNSDSQQYIRDKEYRYIYTNNYQCMRAGIITFGIIFECLSVALIIYSFIF